MKKLFLLNLLIIIISSGTFLFSAQLGDVDESNEVDIVDALLVAQYYVGLNPAALINVSVSDVNADGATDILDALLISQYYVGIITEFPGGTSTPGPTEDFILESVYTMSLENPYARQWTISSADNSLVEILSYQDGTGETNSYSVSDLQISQLRDAITGIEDYSYHNNGYTDCVYKTYLISFSSGDINVAITNCYSPPDEASTSPPVDTAISNFSDTVDAVIDEITGVN